MPSQNMRRRALVLGSASRTRLIGAFCGLLITRSSIGCDPAATGGSICASFRITCLTSSEEIRFGFWRLLMAAASRATGFRGAAKSPDKLIDESASLVLNS